MCLTCGEVSCCDSSPGKHAAHHHRSTGHPVIASVEPGEQWAWCYVDRAYLSELPGARHHASDTGGTSENSRWRWLDFELPFPWRVVRPPRRD